MRKIAIVGSGNLGSITPEMKRLVKEADVEIISVEDLKQEDYKPTYIPEQVCTIHPAPITPDIVFQDLPRMGKGGSKHGRNGEKIKKDRKKNKIKKTHRRRK